MQQLFRSLIILIQPYMLRGRNSLILRSTIGLYRLVQLLVECTDTAADRCHGWDGTPVPSQPKTVYTVRKCSWGWENLSPETFRAEL